MKDLSVTDICVANCEFLKVLRTATDNKKYPFLWIFNLNNQYSNSYDDDQLSSSLELVALMQDYLRKNRSTCGHLIGEQREVIQIIHKGISRSEVVKDGRLCEAFNKVFYEAVVKDSK